MNNIRVLDDKTINQIAAGEVVERPVSVVKELVENSIDAGSTNISVEIKEGGIDLIRVTDNGSGIDRDSIKTAFLRHATSKIKSIEDLVSVKSLGFRGEALSSIAAVGQIELFTKVKGQMIGYRYCIQGGREMSFDEAGIPEGTTIICRNLFFNTPARRKFLKSPMTEANYITELMERLILSHPDIGFKYIVNGREKLSSPGNNDVRQNIYSIFGREMANLVIKIDEQREDLKITGYIGKPETGRGNRNFELFFVNNRCVKSSVLSKAVEEAYSNFLMLHKYPFTVLYFDIPQEKLDVNVHPAKTEIRFLDEAVLYKELTEVITGALSHKEMIPEVVNEENDAKKIIPALSLKAEPDKAISQAANLPGACGTDILLSDTLTEDIVNIKPKNSYNDEVDLTYIPAPEPFETKEIAEYKEIKQEEIKDIRQENLFDEEFLTEKALKKHKIVGQVFDTYWIVELENKMYIIDQHAAHEKVLYEKFKKKIDNNEIYSQQLSPAIIVSLNIQEEETLKKYQENFKSLGFEVEHFGGREYAITAVPVDLFGHDERTLFLSVLDEMSQVSKISDLKGVNDRIATMACKAAIKGNMHFSFAEASSLIDQLLILDNPYNCPHGRPTIVSYSKTEIEKLFKRIV